MSVVTEAELTANKNKIIELVNNYNDLSNGYSIKLANEIVKIQADIKKMKTFWTTDSGNKTIEDLLTMATNLAMNLRDLNMLVSFSEDDISWQKKYVGSTTGSMSNKN